MGGRTRSVVTTVAAFALLVVLWELVKLVVPDNGVVVTRSSPFLMLPGGT